MGMVPDAGMASPVNRPPSSSKKKEIEPRECPGVSRTLIVFPFSHETVFPSFNSRVTRTGPPTNSKKLRIGLSRYCFSTSSIQGLSAGWAQKNADEVFLIARHPPI